MKIGVITYHAVSNFGAQLQTVSTIGFLKQKGIEPVVIHWYPKDLDELYKKTISKEQYDCHRDFAEKYMPLTKLCQTEDELLQVIDENNLDAIMLGSDAPFNFLPVSQRKKFSKRNLRIIETSCTSDHILEGNPFWGSFIPKLKKDIPVVVFSVSSQNAMYKKTNKLEYKQLKTALERFRYITVRDEWTKQMVQYFIGNADIQITPDPVFSFNQNSYLPVLSKQELNQKYNLPDKYVLVSFSRKEVPYQLVKGIEKELITKGYTPVSLPHTNGCIDFGLANKISLPLSPLDWYFLIKYSAGYIGERMHPIIVAIHNAVPFFCFDTNGAIIRRIPYTNIFGKIIKESSKIYHILSKADLLSNMVLINKDMKKITPQIVVEKLLTFDKQKMLMFSDKQLQHYSEFMNEILDFLNNKT